MAKRFVNMQRANFAVCEAFVRFRKLRANTRTKVGLSESPFGAIPSESQVTQGA